MTNSKQKRRRGFFFKRGSGYFVLLFGPSLLLLAVMSFVHSKEKPDGLIDHQLLDLPTEEELDLHQEDLNRMRESLEEVLEEEIHEFEFEEVPEPEVPFELEETPEPKFRIEIYYYRSPGFHLASSKAQSFRAKLV